MSQSPSTPTALPPEASSEASTLDLRFDLNQDIDSDRMEANAENLMDLLFADVDRVLERGVSLPVEAPPEQSAVREAVEGAAPQPVLPLETILPPKLSPRDLIPQPVELAEPPPPPEPTTEKATQWSPLWVAVLCGSLLLSAGILCFLFRAQVTQAWLSVLNRFYADPAATTVASSPVNPQADPKTQENADFLSYLKRSLDRLAHKDAEVAASPSASPAPTPSVVERVYVPVYPSAQTQTAQPAPTGTAVLPSAATAGAKPAPAASPLPSVAASPVPNIADAATRTLIGVLELGDKSAALFEVNGTPQRIEVGEQIGTSGWTLVSISNQEAIVRRNGEVRSIYVGQRF